MEKERKTISASVRQEIHNRVEDYQERNSQENKSDAVKDLIETGLRENSNPVITRWFERVVEGVGFVLLVALLSLMAGFAGIISAMNAALYAVLCLFVAMGLLSWVYFVRVLSGQTSMGAWLRGDEE